MLVPLTEQLKQLLKTVTYGNSEAQVRDSKEVRGNGHGAARKPPVLPGFLERLCNHARLAEKPTEHEGAIIVRDFP